jgi:hypothetical protein
MDHAFWGPHFTNAQIGTLLEAAAPEVLAEGCTPTLSTTKRACE